MNLEIIANKVISLSEIVGNFIQVESKKFTNSDIEHKGLHNLVTYVDKTAEKMLVEKLGESGFEINDDASIMARSLWQSAKPDLAGFLAKASHVKRFKTLHIESDLEACLKFDSFEGMPEPIGIDIQKMWKRSINSTSLEDFKKLFTNENIRRNFPSKYLVRGHPLTNEQLDWLLDNQNRVNTYVIFQYLESTLMPEEQVQKIIKFPKFLRRFKEDFDSKLVANVQAVITSTKIKACREAIEKVHIKDDLLDYIAKIVCSTRNNGDIFLGASTRASLAIMKASKAIAALSGRSFVTPDDIRFVAGPVLNHRIILSSDRELEGTKEEEIINGLIQKIEVPR